MTGPFGTPVGPWLTAGTLVYVLDERETANRFTARIEGGYEINYKRDPVRTSDSEIAAITRAIAQVPAMLALVELARKCADGGYEMPDDLAVMAREIAAELEEK